MRKTTSGFTIVELLVVIAIIGILTAVGLFSFSAIQSDARNSQRSSKVTAIAEALEQYYDRNGEYPSCTAMTAGNITTVTLPELDSSNLTAPTAVSGTNSIQLGCGEVPTGTDGFAYVGDGSLNCLTGTACLRYSLEYREEGSNSIKPLTSRHTVSSAGSVAVPSTPAMTITFSGDNHVIATISPAVTCASGTPYYRIQRAENDVWIGEYSAPSTTVMTLPSPPIAAYGFKYSYRSQARCWTSNYSYSAWITSPTVYRVRHIDTIPATPTVTASTTNWYNTTYSWNATTNCPTGTSARYQYNFTSSSGFDFGWIETTGTSAVFSTPTFGYTYTTKVKAQCYNSYTEADDDNWSSIGSFTYTRSFPSIQVLVVAGGGAGGSSTSDDSGGGGGGGAVLYHAAKPTASQSYSVTIGNGGASNSAQGGNSSFNNEITAYGGGGGGPTNEGGYNGGSGGGGAGAEDGSTNSRGLATNNGLPTSGATFYGNYGGLGQWRNDGKAGGGGGGGGMIGGSGYDGGGNGKMTGGNGWLSSISGTNTYYAGGGGGGSCCYWGAGGAGGGGNGAEDGRGSNAVANTGGGGGGGSGSGGGYGGSGIVIIRYANSAMGATGGTITSSGSDTIHTFTSNGTFTVY